MGAEAVGVAGAAAGAIPAVAAEGAAAEAAEAARPTVAAEAAEGRAAAEGGCASVTVLVASAAVMMIHRFIMSEPPSRLPTCAALRTTLKRQKEARSNRASSSAPLVPVDPRIRPCPRPAGPVARTGQV
ncbi:protein of unknown function [Methylorubrum extorquens]|uniref:Uncharacterized protein n=1 Tax=Methylorubrum extorquens TaxID=408 RepID=A0A2N9AM09_METEX|nr:protein of unknown function [Methylorubrum extorquens]